MTNFERLRLFHAALATTALLAYATGEAGLIHAWIGYAVAAIIVFRLLWAIVGPRQIGIERLVPHLRDFRGSFSVHHPVVSKALLTGLIGSLLVVTATGIAIDRFRSSQGGTASSAAPLERARPIYAGTRLMAQALADDDRRASRDRRGGRSTKWLRELHEVAASLMLAFAGMHTTYVLLFKRKLGLFMLFAHEARRAGIDH